MLLLAAMTGILVLAGYLMFDTIGFFVAIALLVFGLFFSPRISTSMLLRHYHAQRITRSEAPGLVDLMEHLCERGGLSNRPLYYIPSRLPNAFAAGVGQESFVAVTDGLLRLLNGRELAGVLAHEVAHIINNDIKVLGTADTITRTASLFSRIGLLLVLFSGIGHVMGLTWVNFVVGGLVLFFAPSILVMLQLAISRTREFDADLGAAELTEDPAGLASALQKLTPPKQRSLLERLLSPGPRRSQPAMLRTHPPTEERVARLMELERLKQEADQAAREEAKRKLAAALPDKVDSENEVIRIGFPPVKRKPRYHPTNGLWY